MNCTNLCNFTLGFKVWSLMSARGIETKNIQMVDLKKANSTDGESPTCELHTLEGIKTTNLRWLLKVNFYTTWIQPLWKMYPTIPDRDTMMPKFEKNSQAVHTSKLKRPSAFKTAKKFQSLLNRRVPSTMLSSVNEPTGILTPSQLGVSHVSLSSVQQPLNPYSNSQHSNLIANNILLSVRVSSWFFKTSCVVFWEIVEIKLDFSSFGLLSRSK